MPWSKIYLLKATFVRLKSFVQSYREAYLTCPTCDKAIPGQCFQYDGQRHIFDTHPSLNGHAESKVITAWMRATGVSLGVD
jgi:hypothetical protein